MSYISTTIQGILQETGGDYCGRDVLLQPLWTIH